MFFKLLLLFVIIFLIEICLIIKVGGLIGAGSTVVLLLLISLAGAWLVRRQGFAVLRNIQWELAQGRLPAAELLDGAIILVGGVLLLTPGFFTDLLGILLLIPFIRSLVKQLLRYWLQHRPVHRGITIYRN